MRKLIIFIFLGICGLYSFAFAQVGLDKREIRHVIEPKKEIVGSISVKNVSKKAVNIKAYMEDFVYAAPYEGLKELKPLGSTERSCGEWITVNPSEFTLQVDETKNVHYTIKVPEGVKGGYYGALFFEKGPEGPIADKGIGLILRTGCSFLLETKDSVRKAQIIDLSVDTDNIEAYLLNSGNVVLEAKGSYYIIDKKNVVVDRGEIKKYYLPPEEKVLFKINVSEQVPKGNYTLVINFDIRESEVLVKEVDFSMDRARGIRITSIRD